MSAENTRLVLIAVFAAFGVGNIGSLLLIFFKLQSIKEMMRSARYDLWPGR